MGATDMVDASRKRRTRPRPVAAAWLLGLLLALAPAGCNIVDGVGREVEAIGKGIRDVTNDHHPYRN